ncbi:MAG: hypothetical protein GY714_30790 [Desulfobacterales bacterium]|nr:hypothetical protein [Desulfobacterales bacterium]
MVWGGGQGAQSELEERGLGNARCGAIASPRECGDLHAIDFEELLAGEGVVLV